MDDGSKRVGELHDFIPPQTFGTQRQMYPLVAVLNPGDGPDEQLLPITNLRWDDELGMLRLEVENE